MTRLGNVAENFSTSGGLSKLNLLLEATMLLHSQLPLDAVLEAMLDRAIVDHGGGSRTVAGGGSAGELRQRLAGQKGAAGVLRSTLSPSQTAIGMAISQASSVITEDLHLADRRAAGCAEHHRAGLRAVVAIPLYAMPRANTEASMLHMKRGKLLGVLYLDSSRPAAFSKLDHQILDAIAVESASILDNARLVEHERERQRIEQELGIARKIQQALLPREFRDYPHLTISGVNTPCTEVGGDYFDVFPIDEQRTAFLIADVSGKGLGAALLTPMLQGALSAMTIGVAPERVFQHVNRFLCDHAEVGRYATMFFGILDREGNLEYINAGHPSPLLLRPECVTELYLKGSLPVGLIPEAEHTMAHAKLEPGETLILFSDGVTEAADIGDDLFGVPRLQESLLEHFDSPLDRVQDAVVEPWSDLARSLLRPTISHFFWSATSAERARKHRFASVGRYFRTDSARSDMSIPQQIGRYEIMEELGRGAMGTVYRAKDPAMDRVVALKTIISAALASEQGSEMRERFFREARAAGALAHPGIVPVFDVGEHEGTAISGDGVRQRRTLANAAEKGERLDLDRMCEIGQKIAEALGYAHQRGVVHRDIKPANILLTSREIYGDRAAQDHRLRRRETCRGRGDHDRARCWARRPSCRRSNSPARRSMAARISFHWASCCTGWLPANSHSPAKA